MRFEFVAWPTYRSIPSNSLSLPARPAARALVDKTSNSRGVGCRLSYAMAPPLQNMCLLNDGCCRSNGSDRCRLRSSSEDGGSLEGRPSTASRLPVSRDLCHTCEIGQESISYSACDLYFTRSKMLLSGDTNCPLTGSRMTIHQEEFCRSATGPCYRTTTRVASIAICLLAANKECEYGKTRTRFMVRSCQVPPLLAETYTDAGNGTFLQYSYRTIGSTLTRSR